jgi:type 1 glutamine amidotransferase
LRSDHCRKEGERDFSGFTGFTQILFPNPSIRDWTAGAETAKVFLMHLAIFSLLVATLGLACSLPPFARGAETPIRQVLVFTKSSGFEHSVIKQADGAPSHIEKVLTSLAAEHRLQFTFTKDGGVFTPENIARYDALLFFTSGDLTQAGNDKNPPMTPAGKAALLEAVKNGKGFIGVHSASDTFRSPGPNTRNNEADIDPYIAMLGGEFSVHGKQQVARIACVDPQFPGLPSVNKGHLDGLNIMEEWYTLRNLAPDLHVLFAQQTSGMSEWMYQRPPYPAAWARMHGKGRVFYSALAHREDTWTNPAFQQILLAGIHWAVGDVQADVTPNVAQVCPGYETLPSPPPKPTPSIPPNAVPSPAAR